MNKKEAELNITKDMVMQQISVLEQWIPVYKELGQYHQRYHAENELKRLNKLLVKLSKQKQ